MTKKVRLSLFPVGFSRSFVETPEVEWRAHIAAGKHLPPASTK